MRSLIESESDLSRIVKATTSVEGVLAVILFGSRARGEYDEYSDYDLLVVFEDDEVLWENWDELYERVGELKLFTQVIAKTMEEFWEKTEPTFLKSVLNEGRLLYLKYPLRAPACLVGMRSMAIISYTLSSLRQTDKMKLLYTIYGKRVRGKRYPGLMDEFNGMKLGEGCFIIDREGLQKALETLRRYRAKYKVYDAFLPL